MKKIKIFINKIIVTLGIIFLMYNIFLGFESKNIFIMIGSLCSFYSIIYIVSALIYKK